ncbi:Bifunctional folate synthesis protein [Polystyrenella longa]|uniref:2-amino-4-hydroxy-6-hydroxymethyldihydropteridine pyrophosphokinase n=1 Tax=Polystyrenella longa TaxID=2528007 RepID=A0A518CPX3_9PLAN|nr:2-amino-4-hydroxy-6-hydroxymethyldihydropteridine diphosphokinase [Polystyrenella longa]QDU81280.1 Bifunctional folate synthesis protein [Polystyrenella longa]
MAGDKAYISLGGNQGNPIETMQQSLQQLAALDGIEIDRVSSFYQTAPVGTYAGDSFYNAVAELETTLPPIDLLNHLLQIEQELGRIRTLHWGPRVIDLDLLFYDEQIIHLPQLVLPHPAAWYRRFVLVPLVEIAPELLHPVKLATIAELLRLTEVVPYQVHLIGSDTDLDIARRASSAFPQINVKQIDSVADLAAPHSMLLFVQPTETITWEDSPLLTRIDLQTVLESQLQETMVNLFTSALGEVNRSV